MSKALLCAIGSFMTPPPPLQKRMCGIGRSVEVWTVETSMVKS